MVPSFETVVEVSLQMMWITCLLSLPTLLAALIVGIAISLIQTLTSVQEMTLTFVPKLIAVLGVLAFTLPWMIQITVEYTVDLWSKM